MLFLSRPLADELLLSFEPDCSCAFAYVSSGSGWWRFLLEGSRERARIYGAVARASARWLRGEKAFVRFIIEALGQASRAADGCFSTHSPIRARRSAARFRLFGHDIAGENDRGVALYLARVSINSARLKFASASRCGLGSDDRRQFVSPIPKRSHSHWAMARSDAARRGGVKTTARAHPAGGKTLQHAGHRLHDRPPGSRGDDEPPRHMTVKENRPSTGSSALTCRPLAVSHRRTRHAY